MKKTGPKLLTMEQTWEKLLKRVKIVGDCWLVIGGKTASIGYKFTRYNADEWYAHRFSYFRANKTLPGEIIMHSCDRANCINPAHLVAGTHAENVADKVRKGRHPKGVASSASRLTEQQALEIFNSPIRSYAELAVIYGISKGGIHNIRSGRTWSHVTGKHFGN